ncbi:MAG TPA: alpha/beta hydrolase [Candidatus Binataceae bacterium]|nr:alpha/beta hydrolase [Candidatus Binataceae bacterium]
MRRDIEINAEGAILRGWLYLPERVSNPVPGVVMAHGFSAVKEMYLDRYAEVFAAAGLAALVFDNRNFGASDGQPRQEIDPWQQVRDYRHAITWLRRQPQIDPQRIGVWGSSYSGGHVLVVGAIDRRVKCVVSQVPLVSGSRNLKRLVRADMAAPLREQFDADRDARLGGAAPAMVPVVTSELNGVAALPTADSWEWFTETGKTRAPSWRNEVTLRTVEMLSEYEPGSYIDRISPTPLLMVIAAQDHLAVADEAFAAFNRALEPKRLVVLGGGHFDAYVKDFTLSSDSAREWFVRYLAA